jgi:predicted nucleic acid-binding protein
MRLIETPLHQGAWRLWKRWRSEGRRIVAPALLLYEITNAFHQYVRHGLLSPSELDSILTDINELNILLVEDIDLHRKAAELAREFELKATYDAHYLALAQRMDAEFWTYDKRLVRSVGKAFPWVKLA